jgi:N-acetylneuraminate lyase
MNSTLHGLIAAPHTPFATNGDLDIKVIPQQAALLAHNGVSGAFVCGTTGEGYGMTIAERKQVAEVWRTETAGALKLVVHVGHSSLGESCDLARHAEKTGADAIATIAPSFFKPPGPVELVAWCQRIAEAAPTLPFYYYHMPSMTGVSISATDFLNEAAGRIRNLAGVKFTHEDLTDFGQATTLAKGRFAMLFGRDEILLDGLPLGAKGAVGSTYNFAAPLFNRILHAYAAGDLESAREDQRQAGEFIAVLARFGGLAAGKAVMKFIGVDCGPVRLPLRALTPDEESRLRTELEQVGFFDYCCALPVS